MNAIYIIEDLNIGFDYTYPNECNDFKKTSIIVLQKCGNYLRNRNFHSHTYTMHEAKQFTTIDDQTSKEKSDEV